MRTREEREFRDRIGRKMGGRGVFGEKLRLRGE